MRCEDCEGKGFKVVQVGKPCVSCKGSGRTPAAVWLIWSFEHNAWWRANRSGYSTTVAEAGLYTADEALQILEQSSPEPGNEIPVHRDRAADDKWPATWAAERRV